MTRTIHKTTAMAIVLVAGVIAVGIAACTPSPEAVYIGAPDPCVGRQAIELAVEEINAGGGIQGAELRVKFASAQNGQTRVHQAVSIADSLAKDPKVIAVVGHDTSLESLPAAHVYNRNGIVQIVPSSSNPLITDIGPWIFRLSADDEQQGAFLAEVARARLNFGKIAVLFVNNDYGKMLAQSFVDSFERRRSRLHRFLCRGRLGRG
jgi:branched-chain amino acid transport system substrate-binding protein